MTREFPRKPDFIASPRARSLTICLLVLQLGGCAADLVSEQVFLRAALCLASANAAAELVAFSLWLLLSLSWIAGLIATRFAAARPAYWALLIAIPLAWAARSWLVRDGLFFCDGP